MLQVLSRFVCDFSIASMQIFDMWLKVIKQRHSGVFRLPVEEILNVFDLIKKPLKPFSKLMKGFDKIRAWAVHGFQLIKLICNKPKSFDLKSISSVFFGFKIFSVQLINQLTYRLVNQVCQTLNSLSLIAFLQFGKFFLVAIGKKSSSKDSYQASDCLNPRSSRLRIKSAANLAKVKKTLHKNPLSFTYDQSIGALS